MKSILSLRTLTVAAFFAVFAFVGVGVMSVPKSLHAEEGTAVVDNQFVDGNWFSIAEDKGESFKVGSPTQLALATQMEKYQNAVDENDTVAAEHFAIRSWVKGWEAAEQGRQAFESGDTVKAKKDFSRAKRYGVKAQKPSAGLGESSNRGHDDTAAAFKGDSSVEGKRVVAYAEKWLAKIGGASEE